MTYSNDPGSSPRNEALIGLQILAGVGLVVGIILIIVGAVMQGNVSELGVAINGENPLPGVGWYIWGGALTNIGLLAMFALLTVNAVRWRPPAPKQAFPADDDLDVVAGMERLKTLREQEGDITDYRSSAI